MTEARSRRASAVLGLAAGLLASADLQAAPWRHLTEVDGLPGQQVQFVERHGDAVWAGTLDGLVAFRRGQPATVVTGEAVWDIEPMQEGRYWIGTGSGILLLEGATTSRSLEGYSVGRLARFGADCCWAIADREDQTQLLEHCDGEWRPVPRFAKQQVTDMFPARDGMMVWVLLETDGLLAADPAAEPERWAHHLEGVRVPSFCEDTKGRIWCGTWGRGVMRLEGETWTHELEEEDAAVTTIKEDGRGHIWAATNANGLWEYDGERWTNHLREEGTINVLQVPSDGRVYVSSQSVCSLRVWTGEKWETLVEAPSVFRAVTVGPAGKLWAGNTLTGLYVQP
jgi:ligand-binding sensor domain-containing protein